MVGPVVVVLLPELVEVGLLTDGVLARDAHRPFESPVHAFVAGVLLRLSRRDSLRHDPESVCGYSRVCVWPAECSSVRFGWVKRG